MMSDCCQKQENRTTVQRDERTWHERCTECGRNHYGMNVDVLHLGLRFTIVPPASGN